jgi:hypothetical protein
MAESTHSQHCRQCKLRVRELLTALYGDCLVNHAFRWPSHPGAYSGLVGETLQRIFDSLRGYRGYENFIRSGEMPPCDYFVRWRGFIVEFDESQHFTQPRLVTLRCYPRELAVGFDLREWIGLCESLNSEDPSPPDRDERRAWYDCLRDLLPHYYGLQPTVRFHAQGFRWCELRTTSMEDRRRFESFLGTH